MLGQLRKTAGSPETGLPVSNFNTADCRYSNLSATAEMISTSSAKGTPNLTLKVKPSLFSCANISTEISEVLGFFIALSPKIDFGSTVCGSWAVAVLRGQNEHPYRLSSLLGNPRREFFIGNAAFGNERTLRQEGFCKETAGSPEAGLPVSNNNTADCCYSNLSATAEMISTSSAKGTPNLTLKVKPSLFSCANISTEISEVLGFLIASSPSCDFGSTVSGSWAVAVLRGQNEHPYRLSSLLGNPRREFFTGNDFFCVKQSRKSTGAELVEPLELPIPRREFYRKFFIGNAAFGNERTLRQEGFCKETAGSPEAGLPVLNFNTTDCRYSNLSATAEMISTSSAKGTPSFTLKVKPSLFSCANISTEISEVFVCFIALSPRIDFGSTVSGSWAVAVFSSTAPAVPAVAFHFGSFLPQIPARILYEYRQRLNARFSKQSLFFGKRENTLISLVRVRHFTRVYAAEKMPEQNNRPGIVRRYRLIKSISAAAQITVRETEPSKLTIKSALTDNSSNTVRSSSSRITRAFTTCLLAYQGSDACLRRFRPCVFLPFEKLGARLIGASAYLSESILNRKTKGLNHTNHYWQWLRAEKMPEQNNRPGIVRRYRLIKSASAAAPITAKETEPSKLTEKSALTDNSLNTIRSRISRSFLIMATNLLIQGLGACPRRLEPCVFLPLRNLEDFVSKGASAYLSESILSRKTKGLNHTSHYWQWLRAEKMPEQNNRPGIVRRYRLIKSASAAAPITAKETEPSKLTEKSALTDNSLNTIRSRKSRTSLLMTTNLLIQGLGACPRRLEPCVFLPLRNLEDFVSKGASAYLSESILSRKTKGLNHTSHYWQWLRAEKMPEQNNRPGIVRHYRLIKSTSAAAQITVRETEPSKLTEKSALTDNSSNTVRSSSSRIVLLFTTCLLAYQGPDAWPKRFRPCVFLPFEKLGARLIGTSAPSFRSIPNRKTVQDSTCLRQKGSQHKYQNSAALIASVHYRFLLSQAGRTVPELTFGG